MQAGGRKLPEVCMPSHFIHSFVWNEKRGSHNGIIYCTVFCFLALCTYMFVLIWGKNPFLEQKIDLPKPAVVSFSFDYFFLIFVQGWTKKVTNASN